MRVVYLRLPSGSFTELELKLDVAKHLSGFTEHHFIKSECRMAFKKDGDILEELVGIYQEIKDDSYSKDFIDFLESHCLRIKEEDIIGIVHPREWSTKVGSRLYTDMKIVNDISVEFGIPVLEVGIKNG